MKFARVTARITAVGATLLMATVPGIATAANGSADEAARPVAYAFTGAYEVPELEGTDYDKFTKVYRSPSRPGVSGVLPGTPESAKDFIPVGPYSTGTSWFIHVNAQNGVFDSSVPPAGATQDAYFTSAAALDRGHAASARVRADYMLEAQNSRYDTATDHRWLYLDDVSSTASCMSPRGATAGATAARLWVRQPDRTLAQVPVPEGTGVYQVAGVPLRLAEITMENQNQPQFADVSIRQVHGPEDLVQTDQWSTGEVNAAAGWRVDVVSYIVVDGWRTDLYHSALTLGATTCSINR